MVNTKEQSYQVIDCPTNGTGGQDCGTFRYDDLPQRIKDAIAQDAKAEEWELPGLSRGNYGDPLSDLVTLVRLVN